MGEAAGWDALRLEMPERVPRVEFSANLHWPLVAAVTGIDAARIENRPAAGREFVRAWDYAWLWSTPVNRELLASRGRVTRMGHAVYAENAAGLSDFDAKVFEGFADPEQALAFDPCEEYGGIDIKQYAGLMEKWYADRRTEFPGPLHMGGTYVTLFSGLIEIFGWDMLLLAAATDERRFARVIESYYRWINQFYLAYAESDVPVIMVHDDLCWTAGPVFHPDWYRRYIFPRYKQLWAPLKEAGKKIMFTSDGNWTEFFDDVVACGADHVVMEPCADMALFAAKHGRRCGFTGNADTRVLLQGGRAEIRAEVERCMAVGKPYPGFIMAVGNHIPPNTPVENALYYDEVYRELSRR